MVPGRPCAADRPSGVVPRHVHAVKIRVAAAHLPVGRYIPCATGHPLVVAVGPHDKAVLCAIGRVVEVYSIPDSNPAIEELVERGRPGETADIHPGTASDSIVANCPSVRSRGVHVHIVEIGVCSADRCRGRPTRARQARVVATHAHGDAGIDRGQIYRVEVNRTDATRNLPPGAGTVVEDIGTAIAYGVPVVSVNEVDAVQVLDGPPRGVALYLEVGPVVEEDRPPVANEPGVIVVHRVDVVQVDL